MYIVVSVSLVLRTAYPIPSSYLKLTLDIFIRISNVIQPISSFLRPPRHVRCWMKNESCEPNGCHGIYRLNTNGQEEPLRTNGASGEGFGISPANGRVGILLGTTTTFHIKYIYKHILINVVWSGSYCGWKTLIHIRAISKQQCEKAMSQRCVTSIAACGLAMPMIHDLLFGTT